MTEDYISHYGVLGMKWGVRKQRSSSPYSSNPSINKAQKKLASNTMKTVGKIKKNYKQQQAIRSRASEINKSQAKKGSTKQKIANALYGTKTRSNITSIALGLAISGGIYAIGRKSMKTNPALKSALGMSVTKLNPIMKGSVYDRKAFAMYDNSSRSTISVKEYRRAAGLVTDATRNKNRAKTVGTKIGRSAQAKMVRDYKINAFDRKRLYRK